ncbi:hypothetical protein [Streptomyces sp. NBRC 109706]|uniref:hypothetical protein n=1 Tax=Streptomyces sp. NBRC 109706 TaxID=1550035 RepID=UPI000782EB2F|nr:hypothetical protein [Streptomyces sp. NBRC 109706]
MSTNSVDDVLANIDAVLDGTSAAAPGSEDNDTKDYADRAEDGIKRSSGQSRALVPDNTLPPPEVPEISPEPRVRPMRVTTAGSLPPPGQTIDLGKEHRPTQPKSGGDGAKDDGLEDDPEDEGGDDEPARLRPPRSPRETPPEDEPDNPPAPRSAPAQDGERGALAALVPKRLQQPFWRWLAYNGSAAAAGSYIGLTSYLSLLPPAAEWAAGGVFGAAGAIACGYGTWWLVTTPIISRYLHILGQIAAILIAAEVGRQSGELAVTAIAPYAAQYAGLTYQQTALLVVAAGICGPTGGLVWRLRHQGPLTRWLARIPFVSSVLACALYGPGIA